MDQHVFICNYFIIFLFLLNNTRELHVLTWAALEVWQHNSDFDACPQEKKLQFQEKVDKLKDRSKRMFETIDERRSDMIQKWEEKSRDFIDAFLLLFGREGRLVSLVCGVMSSRLSGWRCEGHRWITEAQKIIHASHKIGEKSSHFNNLN